MGNPLEGRQVLELGPPALAEHTERVLRQFGFAEAEIGILRSATAL